MNMGADEPGWYFVGNGQMRYMDSNGWTDQYRDHDRATKASDVGAPLPPVVVGVPPVVVGQADGAADRRPGAPGPSSFTGSFSSAAHRLIALLVPLMASLWRLIAEGYRQGSASLSARSVASQQRTATPTSHSQSSVTTQGTVLGHRYNSPPNWPAPSSPEWVPPQGWMPDPSWGPAPDGWNFWVEISNASNTPRQASQGFKNTYVSSASVRRGFFLSRHAVTLAVLVMILSMGVSSYLSSAMRNLQSSHDLGNELIYSTLVAYNSTSLEPYQRDYTGNDSFCMDTQRRGSWNYVGDPGWVKNLAECKDLQAAANVVFTSEQNSRQKWADLWRWIAYGMAIFLLWRLGFAYKRRNGAPHRCQFCLQRVPDKASVCHHCSRDLTVAS